jgi:hypothetical protein
MYGGDLLGMANFIKGAGCFNDEGESGYQDLVGNLQSAQVMLWGEIAVAVVAAFVGAHALRKMFKPGGKWHDAGLEALLLLIEDGAAIGAYVFLSSSSKAILLASFGAMCVAPPPEYSPGSVRMCISELPTNTCSIDFIGRHVNLCGRTVPHVSANFRIEGMSEGSLDDAALGLLQKGIGAAAGVEGDTVSIDFFQDITLRRAGEEAVSVWSYIDTESAAAAETAGVRLAEAAYGDALLVSLQADPHRVSSRGCGAGARNCSHKQSHLRNLPFA